MTTAVCPYCRGSIDPATDEVVLCAGCDTPHHKDCYEENGGCTVFGCRCAPADEPKLRVSPPELASAGLAPPRVATPSWSPQSVLGLTHGTASTIAAAPRPAPAMELPLEEHKSKMTFVMLGALLGPLGAHNFYAGYKKRAITQLCITALTMGYGAPMSWIWAVIDICTVERDSRGVQFRS